MKPIEFLLAIASLALLVRLSQWSFEAGNRSLIAVMAVIVVAALVGNFAINGWRWQMSPLYLVAVATVLASILNSVLSARSVTLGTAAGVLMTSAAIIACTFLPPPFLPEPSGPYGIGVASLTSLASSLISNRERDETRPGPIVQLWYPALTPTNRQWGLARFLKPDESSVAVVDAQPLRASTRYPVLFYFGGLPGTRIQNHALIRELVSHGFVVASVIYPARLPGMSEAQFQKQLKLMERSMDYSSKSAADESTRFFDDRVRWNSQDASMILDLISNLQPSDQAGKLAGQLDLNRVGIIGFSFGGAVAAETCWRDSRFKLAVNMGGWQFGDMKENSVPCPFMFMMDNEWAISGDIPTSSWLYYSASKDKSDYEHILSNLKQYGGIFVHIDGAAHLNFTEIPLRSPLRYLNRGGGSIDARRAVRIVNACVLEFANQVLNGQPSPLIHGKTSEFAELHVQVWNRHGLAAVDGSRAGA